VCGVCVWMWGVCVVCVGGVWCVCVVCVCVGVVCVWCGVCVVCVWGVCGVCVCVGVVCGVCVCVTECPSVGRKIDSTPCAP